MLAMAIKHVQKVTVPVSDQTTAKEFYTGKLGFEVRSEFPVPMGGEGTKWIEVAPPGAQTVLVLCNWLPDLKPGALKATMLESSNFDADVSALQKAGVELDGPPRETPWGKQASFSDPDGNSFVLTNAPTGV